MVDATGRRTCPSDPPPSSTLPSTLGESRSQHALSATLPPARQAPESAATPKTSDSRAAPLPPSSTLPSTLGESRSQHALSATLPPARQAPESAATPKTSDSRAAPLPSSSTPQTRN